MSDTVCSFIELSRGAYLSNVAVFRGLAGPRRKLGAVLKGNAYGHGFTELLGLAHEATDVLYVIRPEEALAIRRHEAARGLARRDVLVIGAVSPQELVELARAGVSVVVGAPDVAEAFPALRAARARLDAHVHLDTGLSREGFTEAQLEEGAADVLRAGQDVVRVCGVLSHFANTEDVTDQAFARTQLTAFERMSAVLVERLGLTAPLERHIAASAAALVLPASRHDVLRVGISLYGLWPSTETRLSARVVLEEVPTLRPVLSWRCPSQVVKWIPAHSYVGYGCTYRCPAPTRVAVLPVGYWDGYPRLASGKAHVLINGQRCPVLGRVMMNHLIVDVTHAASDDGAVVATLIGADGDEAIGADLLASWAQTINYEVVTRLGPHLPRRVTG